MSLSQFSHFFIYDNFIDDVTEDQIKYFKRIRSTVEKVKASDPGIMFESKDVKKIVRAEMIELDLKMFKDSSNSSVARWLIWQTPVLFDDFFKYKNNIRKKADVKKEILNLLLLHDAIKTSAKNNYDESFPVAFEILSVSLCRALDWITTIEYERFNENRGVGILESREDVKCKRKSFIVEKLDNIYEFMKKAT
jgi:hypothetical protein